MATSIADEIYERYVRALPAQERLRLLAIVADDLAAPPPAAPARSVMELHGLGRDAWKGVDADAYIERLRGEWDERGSCSSPTPF
jgi:hypothetical protein